MVVQKEMNEGKGQKNKGYDEERKDGLEVLFNIPLSSSFLFHHSRLIPAWSPSVPFMDFAILSQEDLLLLQTFASYRER